ncbi:WD repeat-containing protein 46 [Rhinatrema bivittatum]|uniref:WD repeat-containing protein 46 n=1 Tax=Rhinatrema bivittatum TaxID=194408 RepID=UPI0011266A53|nr:WD repeat-containing protein 46 [Rhinatrema bivittatum]
MAVTGSEAGKDTVPTVKRLKRYWEESRTEENPTDAPRNEKPGDGGEKPVGKKKKRRRRKPGKTQQKGPGGGKFVSGKVDPFPGPAPIPQEKVQKFERGKKTKLDQVSNRKLKGHLKTLESKVELAKTQAARFDLLLPEEAGFLEGDEGEDTCTIQQEDIAEAVDITSGCKYFNLDLNQFGPYRLNYTRNGRHLVLGGRRGHVAALDWNSKSLMCEMNVMESIADIKWLHTENMFAVAQKKWLYIYDNQGVELHCVKKFNDVLRMEFLPYHFLLATCSATGFLQYLDISVGKEIAAICTKAGRLDVMAQNPYNAIIHLGHPNGTVSLWSPNLKEPLVKMLCHRGAVRAVTVDKTGTYMATSGLDRKLNVYDVRSYRRLHSYLIPAGASHLNFSQRDLLAAGCGDTVQVYKDVHVKPARKPYMVHRVRQGVHGLQFCPYEDVLGIGHGEGFTSMLVPGAGEPNFDALESNPFCSRKQRQEWEVKALLEKVQPELITLEPGKLGQVDFLTLQQKHRERVERLGFDPLAKEKFEPKYKKKGRSSSGQLLRRKQKVSQEEKRKLIQESVEEKQRQEKEKRQRETVASLGKRSALDRFKKQPLSK